MKNLKVALACISLAALSGCSSEIDVIREGRLELLPEYTVGQALDNLSFVRAQTGQSLRTNGAEMSFVTPVISRT